MISKTGRYWSTGITVTWSARAHVINGERQEIHSGWMASLDFLDDGFLSDSPAEGSISTQGSLRTRYFVCEEKGVDALTGAIDSLIDDAKRLGIDFRIGDGKAMLYYRGDGEDSNYPAPEGWRQMLREQDDRIGWDTYTTETV
ncbi:hypothetical protein [Streptomyces qinglanensis]|uniref:Uncharacterized protein n=1 Tax=Streptomyces qinglanensis TaxID=943816 RepID=A0A1H9U1Q4_9ACTN|nr:hypothetical protein [Streptomyces qinglanensis]SES03161.1 hypothetical protein SAMN05421870_107208 [Streptomyces qinglanensis]